MMAYHIIKNSVACVRVSIGTSSLPAAGVPGGMKPTIILVPSNGYLLFV